jgi:small-conductance mechanosensitive channel
MLAVALTSLLLLLTHPQPAAAELPDVTMAEPGHGAAMNSGAKAVPREPLATRTAQQVAREAGNEAKRTFSELKEAVFAGLPKLAVVLGLLVAASLAVRACRLVLRRTLSDWPRSTALLALSGVAIWAIALGISVSVVAGDIRAFLGSIGLLGLAASWALQTPIESFTGWLLNAFKGYYRIGDRIEVGDVFGDVHRIDVLTTTLWEIGSPFRPGHVHAEQPTGRLITFPNNQILTGSVVNFTRDFPYLWDELSVSVANESDLRYAVGVLESNATTLFGERMQVPAEEYEKLLRRERLADPVPSHPQVFVSTADAWTNLHIRYLVHARERRAWKSELVLSLAEELRRPEHASRIISVLPRQQIQLIGADGTARDAKWFEPYTVATSEKEIS